MRACPLCGQEIHLRRGRKRVCTICHQAIGRKHKWQFGLSGPEHKDCDNPYGQSPGNDHQKSISCLYE